MATMHVSTVGQVSVSSLAQEVFGSAFLWQTPSWESLLPLPFSSSFGNPAKRCWFACSMVLNLKDSMRLSTRPIMSMESPTLAKYAQGGLAIACTWNSMLVSILTFLSQRGMRLPKRFVTNYCITSNTSETLSFILILKTNWARIIITYTNTHTTVSMFIRIESSSYLQQNASHYCALLPNRSLNLTAPRAEFFVRRRYILSPMLAVKRFCGNNTENVSITSVQNGRR